MHKDCKSSWDMIKDKSILNFAWFYRFLIAGIFILYIFRIDLFTRNNIIFLIYTTIIPKISSL